MTPAAALAACSSVPAPAPDDASASARARIERQMAVLARLAEIGMEIAEACGRDARAMAAAAEDGAPPASSSAPEHRRDPGLAFARVARAVRMTIALEQRLAGDLADLDTADLRAERGRKDHHRIRLSRLVEQAARSGVEARRAALAPAEAWAMRDDQDAVEDEIERLACDAYERLVDAEDGELWDLTFDEAVAAVAKDLGLSPEWTARLRGAVAPPPPPPPVVPGPGWAAAARPDDDDDAEEEPPPDPGILRSLGDGGPRGPQEKLPADSRL